jgi:hypothetical protein
VNFPALFLQPGNQPPLCDAIPLYGLPPLGFRVYPGQRIRVAPVAYLRVESEASPAYGAPPFSLFVEETLSAQPLVGVQIFMKDSW